MGSKFIYLLFFTMFGSSVFAQGSPHEEYIQSSPSQQEFNSNHWREIKKTMIKEARGNAKSKGQEFEQTDFENNNQEASYYEYEEESFSGEYAKNNGERESDYEYEQSDKNYKQGEGENYSSYEKKDRDIEKGEYFSKRTEYKEKKARESKKNNSSGEGSIGTFGSIVLYTLLALFLGLIIYFLFINTIISDSGKKVEEIELERAPIEITKTELELMLEKALADLDYRLAVRIYFIFILKDLSEKEWIVWKKEKTNMSYLIEMRGKNQYNMFDESVSIFELVWYGRYEISSQDYAAIEPKFKSLLKELSSN